MDTKRDERSGLSIAVEIGKNGHRYEILKIDGHVECSILLKRYFAASKRSLVALVRKRRDDESIVSYRLNNTDLNFNSDDNRIRIATVDGSIENDTNDAQFAKSRKHR